MTTTDGSKARTAEGSPPPEPSPSPASSSPAWVRRAAYGLASVCLLGVVAAAVAPRLPELGDFVAHPGRGPKQVTAIAPAALQLPLVLLLVSLICVLRARGLLRYRAVGVWMALFATAAAAADLADLVLSDARWLRYAPAVQWALAPVPVLFALGILIAGIFRRPDEQEIDTAAVLEGIEWARGQVKPNEPSATGRQLARLGRWLVGRPPPPPERFPEAARASEATGICFSGGGIRSAAFNLGALQELQAAGELQQAQYLTAVSGGSYIAGAYALMASCSDPEALRSAPPFAPGTPEEQYLRNRTTYLIPNLSGFGVAMWRLVRGLAVNVAFVGLVVFLIARPYGWFVHRRVDVLCPNGADGCTVPAPFARPGAAGVVLLVLVGLALTAGLVDLMLRPHVAVSAATEAWSLRFIGSALTVAIAWFLLPWIAVKLRHGFPYTPPGAAGLGALSTLGTGLLLLATQSGSKGSGRGQGSLASATMRRVRNSARKVGSGTLRLLVIVVGGIIGPLAFLGGILAAATGAMADGLEVGGFAVWLLLLTVFVLVEGVSDANRWSLQPYYKRRLQTAFALTRRFSASRRDRLEASEIEFSKLLRFPELLDVPELVVCAAANLEDYGLLPPGRSAASFTFSRECVDAGLLGKVPTRAFGALLGQEYSRDFTVPAAQGASGAAFSPAMGKLTNYSTRFVFALLNLRLGVWLPNPRHVARWAAKQPRPPEPLVDQQLVASLQTDHARAQRAFEEAKQTAREARDAMLEKAETLTGEQQEACLAEGARQGAELQAKVFTARLEAERCRRALDDALHPPRQAGRAGGTAFRGFPRFPRPTCLFRELFGVFRSTSPFVYVTDGGHYECLGLAELLQRGCKWIYCFDASGDKTDAFNTVGDAVAIARARLGVRIELDPAALVPKRQEGFNKALHTVGRIFYPGSEESPAHIVFVKLGLTPDVPSDVLAWHQSNRRFPTDGTGDQLYTDQRFEAYRALGAFSTVGAIEAMRRARGEDPLGAPGPLRPAALVDAPAVTPVPASATPNGRG